jgi:enterochelin esterase-like enzyme
VLEPQSTVLFLLLILGFAGMVWWIARSRHVALKVLAGVIAFVLAVQVGILGVNRYFDYYPTWGSAIADLTNPSSGVAQISDASLVNGSYGKAVVPAPVDKQLAQEQGDIVQVDLTGKRSHISRLGLVYLPPQYFQAAYKHYRFPVIELIHGQPGVPQDWIDVAGVTATLDKLVVTGQARPAVLVMPDANGGQRISLQCLNVNNGPQDMTYLGLDVPNDIVAMLGSRIQPIGPAWGIAGYSEGGYCAANMALHLRREFGFAGVLSGYFAPLPTDLLASGQSVTPFAGKQQRAENSPLAEIRALRPGASIPQFWVGAGSSDRQDEQAADYFMQLLSLYQVDAPVHLAPGGHTMAVWRAQIPAMLEWMTYNLTQAAVKLQHAEAVAKRDRLRCRKIAPVNASLLISQSANHDHKAVGPALRNPGRAGCAPQALRHQKRAPRQHKNRV